MSEKEENSPLSNSPPPKPSPEDRLIEEWRKIAIPPQFRHYRLTRKGLFIVVLIFLILIAIGAFAIRIPFFYTRRNLPLATDFPLLVAKPRRVIGYAEIIRRHSEARQELKEGMKLLAGERIQTAPQSKVILFFESGSKITLDGDSFITLRKRWQPNFVRGGLQITTDTLELDWGRVTVELRKPQKETIVVEVKTPFVTAALNSDRQRTDPSHMTVFLDKTSRTLQITAHDGVVEVEGTRPEDPSRFSLMEFHQITMDAQGKRGDIRLSFPPPTLLYPPKDHTFETETDPPPPLTFRWEPIGRPDMTYEFELSSDADFQNKTLTTKTSEPSVTLNRLESGRYFWRVRGWVTSTLEVENPWSESRSVFVH